MACEQHHYSIINITYSFRRTHHTKQAISCPYSNNQMANNGGYDYNGAN